MLFSKQDKRIQLLQALSCFVLFLTIGFIIYAFSGAFAAEDATDGVNMINGVVKVVGAIVMIVGALFCVVGIVKIAIAHAENQGPEQQKAAMMLATGIVLCILPIILNAIDFSSIVTSALNKATQPS